MRNVTLAVDEADLRAARVRATRESTTVTAVLRARLAEYGRGEPLRPDIETWQARVKAAAGRYPTQLGPSHLRDAAGAAGFAAPLARAAQAPAEPSG
ncbi:MAG: hypothetical protein LBD70_00330 [Bifidobacteriaceae bacterium]|jgi:hypothetical protein|nr:hypothetical protein [Bifidobacteriaceae bacterium]